MKAHFFMIVFNNLKKIIAATLCFSLNFEIYINFNFGFILTENQNFCSNHHHIKNCFFFCFRFALLIFLFKSFK